MTFVRSQDYASPIFRTLMAFAGSAMIGGLATDVAYVVTEDFVWTDASDWFIMVAALFGFFALVCGLIEVLSKRVAAPPLLFSIAAIVAWLIAVADNFVHSHDSWTSVMPWGIALSALAVFALLVAFIASRRVARQAPRERRAPPGVGSNV